MRLFILGLAFVTVAGCTDPASSPDESTATPTANTDTATNEADAIWIDVKDNAYGSMGSVTGTAEDGSDTYKYDVKRAHFGDLLEDISETTETRVTCSDPSLLDRGITLKFAGESASALVQDLANKAGLVVTESGPEQFVLASQK